jgi:hypothetical protein
VIKSIGIRWVGNVTRIAEIRNAYKVLVAKPEGKRLLGTHLRRREENISMDFRKIGSEGADWMHLAEDTDK